MTDSYPPKSTVARFGVALVGPRFVWAWLKRNEAGELETDEAGEQIVSEKEYRAHPGLSFEEYLRYTALQASLTTQATYAQAHIREQVRLASQPGTPPEERDRILQVVTDGQVEEERTRWQLVLDMVLMLVAPSQRDELRPLLEGGNAEDVRALKEHLSKVVIERIEPEVQAAAGVDPTSPPSSSG